MNQNPIINYTWAFNHNVWAMNDHFSNQDKFSAMLSNRKWNYVEATPILRSVNRNLCIKPVRDMICRSFYKSM